MARPRPATAPNARQRSQIETRQRVFDAAVTLFAANGGIKTTITMTARAAGVAAGTVYLHFPDKESLLREVMQVAVAELKRSLAAAASRGTPRTATDDVRRRTEGLVTFAAECPDLAAVLFDPGNLNTLAGAEVFDFLVASQASSLAAGQKKGWLRDDLDPEVAARALVGSFMLVLWWWIRQGADQGPGPGRDVIIAQLAALRLSGTGGS